MPEPSLYMSLFWERVALSLYSLGLIVSLALLWRRHAARAFQISRWLMAAGFFFQFVSVVEMGAAAGHFPITQYSEAANLLALMLTGAFLLIYRVYSPRGLSLLLQPLVFLLTFTSIYGPAGAAHTPLLHPGPGIDNAWIYWHVILTFLGIVALTLAVACALLYLWAEHSLKQHPANLAWRLPPLETLDRMTYLLLLSGFPLLTIGLLIGFYRAGLQWGRAGLSDPKIVLALLTWGLYLILLFGRWAALWRGRRAAWFTLVCFLAAVATWMASSFSRLHDFVR